jgi:O-antigen ligase
LNLYQTIISALIPLFLILSAFRFLWALLIFSLILIFWIYFKKIKTKRKIFRYAFSFLILILLFLSLFRIFAGEYFNLTKEKFANQVINFEKSEERWRYYAWSSAIEKLKASPVYGSGLGEDPEFWTINSLGQWYRTRHESHNVFIDLLYLTGILGLFIFAIIILYYGVYVYKNITQVKERFQPLLIAFLIFFICAILQSMLQPYMNHPGNLILFFSTMGIAVQIIKTQKK